ncbi:MAG: DMT family transporter, partial [Clostridiales bacterium]
EPNPLPFDLRLWPLALFSGIVATAISYLFQGWGQRIIPPMQTSVIFSSMGIFTALFDWLFLDIVFTKQQYLGAVIIISCTLLVAVMPNLEWKKKKIHKIRPYINK